MVRIFLSDDEERLELRGEYLATEADYERELRLYQEGQRGDSILNIFAPGQEIVLEEGRYWLDDDLTLLIDEDL